MRARPLHEVLNMWLSVSIYKDWKLAKHHIAAALENAGDTHSTDDVFDMIIEGKASLFVGKKSA